MKKFLTWHGYAIDSPVEIQGVVENGEVEAIKIFMDGEPISWAMMRPIEIDKRMMKSHKKLLLKYGVEAH